MNPDGTPADFAKIKCVREHQEIDIQASCASHWGPGYFSWELTDVDLFPEMKWSARFVEFMK